MVSASLLALAAPTLVSAEVSLNPALASAAPVLVGGGSDQYHKVYGFCQVEGHAGKVSQKIDSATTHDKCMKACTQDSRCQAFQFDWNFDECYTFNALVQSIGIGDEDFAESQCDVRKGNDGTHNPFHRFYGLCATEIGSDSSRDSRKKGSFEKVDGVDRDGCKEKCVQKGDACKAYQWSNNNDGSCQLYHDVINYVYSDERSKHNGATCVVKFEDK